MRPVSRKTHPLAGFHGAPLPLNTHIQQPIYHHHVLYNASNSLKDIAELVPFAHRYGAKIFVTLNTILHDDELEPAQR
ncbi:hypothetical protein, partial [Citrobacter braakii]|uniref:hypothetical protein n=1 Tax=Citrobacter braakii TaxID=57706 RepID=UPI0037AB763D